ncbi:uncharacterized protein LOC132560250 [Ylistrum balloti]|uniref:uncharacterized protein LOC132560250 n=1 Tax=Ylistrum balloti TaxID=509963 RepID=UPI0029058B4D|nr:uncharacterized protein LOC132560250 [Ylistrum balloti]
MDLGDALFQKLEEKGLNANDVDDQEDDFYRIISILLYGEAKRHSKCRERICTFQTEPENIKYFELFLNQSSNTGSQKKSYQEEFLDDVKKRNYDSTPPTAREIYAACELIGRPIEALVCNYSDKESISPTLQWRLFVPVLGRVTPQTKQSFKMLILLKRHKAIFHAFKPLLGVDNESINGAVNQSMDNASNQSTDAMDDQLSHEIIYQRTDVPRRCYGNRFSNKIFLSPISVADTSYPDASEWKPNTEIDTFYQCLSQEMYGVCDHWKRVKNILFALEEEEDSINVFAAIITDKDSEKEQAMKDHILKMKKEGSKPTKTEMFAAASLLNAYVYVQSFTNGAYTWEIYPPIRNRFCSVEPMDSFVALKCANITETYSIDLSFATNGDNLREAAPKVPGNLLTIKEQIDSITRDVLARRVPCCEGHLHLSHKDNTGRKRPTKARRNPFTDPPSSVRNVLKLLRSEGRELEKIEAYDSTLFRCISKEVSGTEEEFESIRDRCSVGLGADVNEVGDSPRISMREQEQGQIVQALADWLSVSIYIFTQADGNDRVQYQWRSYHPTRSELEADFIHSLGCRYYITLFFDIRSRKYDRVIPISGCNCQLMSPIPLFVETYGEIQHPGIVQISETNHHMTLKRRLPSQFSNEQFVCETRKPLLARQFSESYRVLHERQDMSARFIDSVYEDSHSFYRCLSKELFGTQEQFGLIRKCLLNAIEESRSELEYDLKELASLLGGSPLTLDELKQRITDLRNAENEEIYLASVVFATSIYVLGRGDANDLNSFTWRHFSWNVMKKAYTTHSCDKRSREICPSGGRYYISLFKSSAGHYDRVVPKYELCNCAMMLPEDAETGPLDPSQIRLDVPNQSIDTRGLLVTRNVDMYLTKLRISLNTWLQVSEETEKICHQIVAELENRRFGVNIATIIGGSTGLVGTGLAVAGVIAAPFTGGLSLGLTIAGAAVGGVGGATMAGSKITEVVLGSKATDVLKIKQTLLKAKSDELQTAITEFTESVKTMEVDVKELLRDDSLQAVDSAIFSTISTLIRALHHLYVIPMTVLRVSFQGVAMISAILIPLAVLVDLGSIAHAGWNLSKQSRTQVSEDLRRIAVVLRSCRLQLETWAYGNEEKDDC